MVVFSKRNGLRWPRCAFRRGENAFLTKKCVSPRRNAKNKHRTKNAEPAKPAKPSPSPGRGGDFLFGACLCMSFSFRRRRAEGDIFFLGVCFTCRFRFAGQRGRFFLFGRALCESLSSRGAGEAGSAGFAGSAGGAGETSSPPTETPAKPPAKPFRWPKIAFCRGGTRVLNSKRAFRLDETQNKLTTTSVVNTCAFR